MTGDQRPPESGIELRVLTPDDWKTWRVIRLQALSEAPYAFGSKHEDWAKAPEERWRARLGLLGSHNLVAFLGDAPIAMATGVPGDEPGAVGVISMYVAPAARGRGVGSTLVEAVEQWAQGQRATVLCLDVRASNTPARRLYERHGLVVTGEVDREDPTDPLELRMCKPLGAGSSPS